MSETHEELSLVRGELQAALGRIQSLEQEIEDAKTRREEEAARREQREERDEAAAIAERVGIPRARIQEAIEAARRADEKERLRPVIGELMQEARDAQAAEEEAARAAEEEEKKTRRPSRARAARDDDDTNGKVEDSAPAMPHWSERALGDLLR